MISYITSCIFPPQTPPQLLLELEQAKIHVASSLIAVYLLHLDVWPFFFFIITVSLTLGGGPMIGMMGEETVRCLIGFPCSVVECQHQTCSSLTLLVLCSCFSKSTVLFFFFKLNI